jgi:hypothetical protein
VQVRGPVSGDGDGASDVNGSMMAAARCAAFAHIRAARDRPRQPGQPFGRLRDGNASGLP